MEKIGLPIAVVLGFLVAVSWIGIAGSYHYSRENKQDIQGELRCAQDDLLKEIHELREDIRSIHLMLSEHLNQHQGGSYGTTNYWSNR